MNKKQIYKMIEGRIIGTAQTMMLECIELIYKAGYNEAVDDIEKHYKEQGFKFTDLSKLKKE